MTPVTSSAIAAIGHDPETRTLLVRFRSGETYGYLEVSPEVFKAFLTAASKGRFFHERIDPAFRYVRLEA